MKSLSTYTITQLSITWQLMRRKASALPRGDYSADGFWLSFLPMVYCLPAVTIIYFAQDKFFIQIKPVLNLETPASASQSNNFIFQLLLVDAEWLIFTLALIPLLVLIGAKQRYAPLVIYLNWSKLLILVSFAIIDILYLADLFGLKVYLVFRGVAVIASLIMRVNVVFLILGRGNAAAILIVVFEIFLAIMLVELLSSA